MTITETITGARASVASRLAPATRPLPRLAPPPTLLVAVSLVVLCVSTVLAVVGAFHTGITTDEPIHVMRLRNYLDNGWFALDWNYRGEGPGSEGTNTFVYAPVTMLLLHGWTVLWGGESWGEVATTPHAYDLRHLGIVVIGLVGLLAVAAIGRVLLRSWRWGVVAAAALASIPMWTGHEMFNIKDIPVATGHTLVTLALILFVRKDRPGPALRVGRAALLVGGLTLTLGTRPGMWPGLFAVLVVAAAGILLSTTVRRALGTLAEIGAAGAVAALALVATYPKLFGNPLEAMPRTAEGSSSFMNGERSNRLYVPGHLGMEMPTLLLLFVLTGTVVAVGVLVRHWRGRPVPSTRLALVGVQAFAMPVVAIVLGSDLYHGLRQLLFAIPAMAVLAAYGMAWWLHRRPDRPRLVAAIAAAALVLPAVDQITLQPYQTSYVNLATDLASGSFVGDRDRPGGDFWRVTIPELVRDVPLDRALMCKATVDKETDLSYSFTNGGEAFSTSRSLDCREEPNGPLAPSLLPIPRNVTPMEYDAVFLKTLPDNCTERATVTRKRHGFTTVLSILGRCRVLPAPLTSDGVRVDSPSIGTGTDHDLWRFAIDGWEAWPGEAVVWSKVPQATLAFSADGCGDRCWLRLDVQTVPDDLAVVVDGRPADARIQDDRVIIPLGTPADGDGVWVSLTRHSGETLGLRMTGLEMVRSTEGPA